MSAIKQMIRLRLQGAGYKTIGRIVGVSKNTVKEYLKPIESGTADANQLLSLSDEELERQLLSERNQLDNRRKAVLYRLFPEYSRELQSPGVNRWSLWNEYKTAHPDGYQYTQFCIYFRDYLKNRDACMHFDAIAGEKMYLDFTGKHLSYVDRSTGEIVPCEVLVAVLGYSQMTYVEALPSQKMEDLVPAFCNAVEYFGGVTRAVVPDNMKTAVTEASHYEPILNPTFHELANHYGTTVYPTRPYRPKDKPLVEKYVSIVYTRIFAALRKRTFFSIQELNEAIRQELEHHNDELFQGRPYSRRMRYEQEEKQTLLPLPGERFEIRHHRWVTVMKNGHVQLGEDHHYYSVPYRYIGEKVKLCYTSRRVTIFCHLEQIAVHPRDTKAFAYSTIREHLSSQHQFVAGWSPDFFITWARRLDPAVEAYIRRVLDMKTYPEQTYRSCAGILTQEKKVGKERLIAACKKGISFDTYNYKFIERVLKNGLENLQPEPEQPRLPLHENIRGPEYYLS
jgi:transposase